MPNRTEQQRDPSSSLHPETDDARGGIYPHNGKPALFRLGDTRLKVWSSSFWG